MYCFLLYKYGQLIKYDYTQNSQGIYILFPYNMGFSMTKHVGKILCD